MVAIIIKRTTDLVGVINAVIAENDYLQSTTNSETLCETQKVSMVVFKDTLIFSCPKVESPRLSEIINSKQ